MSRKFDYQYLVIGSGAAGSAAALLAAKYGVKTAIIEADRWGGAPLNYRDVPYGAALKFAQTYMTAVRGARFGISSGSLRYNYPTALNWQATALKRAGGNKKIFEEAGIDCYKGFAQFINSHEVVVGKQQLAAEKILIATGGEVSANGISGAEEVNYWTPNNALRMAKLPEAVMIVGAGSTGCELAEYFGALGVKVLLAEAQERILPREDKEVSEVITKHLRKDLGVKILESSRVVAFEQDKTSKQVVFVHGGKEKSVRVGAIVLATTPEPATDFGLENAGVAYSYQGVAVNSGLQTSVKHIWAAGDIIGGESSTEKAAYEGKLATMNALKKAGSLANYTGFTRMTNTLPAVAKVGLNENDCAKLKLKHKSMVVPIEAVSAANTNDFREGFVKLFAGAKGQLIGATVVAPEADLVVQEIALAIRSGISVEELAGTPHVATGWSEAVRIAARQLAEKN